MASSKCCRRISLSTRSSFTHAFCDGRLENILGELDNRDYKVLVVDSVQTLSTQTLDSGPGSVGQVRECAERLVGEAKRRGIAFILIGHVTKEGASVDKAKTSEASADDGDDANNTSAGASDEGENVAPSNVEAQDDPEEKST